MKIKESTPIGDIATEIQAAIPLFDSLKIDYCCGGQRTLKEACDLAGVPLEKAMTSLSKLKAKDMSNPDAPILWSRKPIRELIDHILERHHAFTRTQLVRLQELSEKVLWAHGTRHPELLRLDILLKEMAGELEGHLTKEEEVVFPYLKRFEEAKTKGEKFMDPFKDDKEKEHPIQVLMWEHGMTGEEWLEIHRLTRDFTTPAEADPSFRAYYRGLKELEDDLHLHIHLENNILFQRITEEGILD
jgi:regulator of cell morphogenesis and NO signaling